MFKERVCAVCGKKFIVAPKHLYKLIIDGHTRLYCSYTCYRVDQVIKEMKKERKAEGDECK